MQSSEFKSRLLELFAEPVDGVAYEEKIRLIEKYLVEYQKKTDDQRDRPNHRKPWTDQELRIVLRDAPTMRNCVKYANLFGRGYGSIEQIYRWASTTDQEVKTKRPDDAFVAHVKRIAKELGWRA